MMSNSGMWTIVLKFVIKAISFLFIVGRNDHIWMIGRSLEGYTYWI